MLDPDFHTVAGIVLTNYAVASLIVLAYNTRLADREPRPHEVVNGRFWGRFGVAFASASGSWTRTTAVF